MGDAKSPISSNIDIRSEKFEILQQRFPLTLERLAQPQEFKAIACQLALEGYIDWEILQAGCNAVATYRIDPERSMPSEELVNRLVEYAESYVETPYSPFPPAEYFVLKGMRSQVHADRLARLVRLTKLTDSSNASIAIKEIEEDRDPQNLISARTKDNFDLWMALFPRFDARTRELSVSPEWRIKIGCDSNDPVSHGFCEDLARDLAKYAAMIEFWLEQLDSARKSELNIAVVEEKLFMKLFPETYSKALEGRTEIYSTPIIMSWRDDENKPHMKLVINTMISNQPRMKRLFYVMCGILNCVGGLPKLEAANKAALLTETLE